MNTVNFSEALSLPTAPPTRAFTPIAIPSTNSSGPWMAPWKTQKCQSYILDNNIKLTATSAAQGR